MRVFIFFLLLTSNALAIEFDLICRGNVVGTVKGESHEASKLLDEYIVVVGMVGKDGKLTKVKSEQVLPTIFYIQLVNTNYPEGRSNFHANYSFNVDGEAFYLDSDRILKFHDPDVKIEYGELSNRKGSISLTTGIAHFYYDYYQHENKTNIRFDFKSQCEGYKEIRKYLMSN